MYQEVDHRPRSLSPQLPQTRGSNTYSARSQPSLCGNELTVCLELTDGRINDVAFQGSRGAISPTSVSLMTTVLTGKGEEEALALFMDVHAVLTEGSDGEVDLARLGSLAARSPMSEFPMRVKCVTLAWHTLRGALDGDGATRTRV